VSEQQAMEAEIRAWEEQLHAAVLEALRLWLPIVRAAVLHEPTALVAAGEQDPTQPPPPAEQPVGQVPPPDPAAVVETEPIWGNLLAAYLLVQIAELWNARLPRIWRRRGRRFRRTHSTRPRTRTVVLLPGGRRVELPPNIPAPAAAPALVPTGPAPQPAPPGGSRAGGPMRVPEPARPRPAETRPAPSTPRGGGTVRVDRTPPTAPGSIDRDPPTTDPGDDGDHGGDEPIILFDPDNRARQRAHLDTVANRTSNLPDDVFRAITLEIDRGIANGESPTDMRDRIGAFLDIESEGGFERWNRRALRIARTESTDAYNAAAMDAALDEEQLFGDPLEKVWLATADDRTRPWHLAVDGQRRPLRRDFRVGGEDLAHPGRGSARNRVNCRCSMMIVPAADPLPDESDRQTERERSDGTRRDPHEVIRRRREQEGIVRDRDRDNGLSASAAREGNSMRQQWSAILAPIGTPTADDRIFAPDGDYTWRPFPRPLWFQHALDNGHMTAVIVGRILSASVADGVIVGHGEFFNADTDENQDAVRTAVQLVADGVIAPSLDMAEMEWSITDRDGQPIPDQVLRSAAEQGLEIPTLFTIRATTFHGATLVGKPAFAESKIWLTDPADGDLIVDGGPAELLASAAGPQWLPDAAAFDDPVLTELTPLTVTPDGRVFGHLAGFNTCHLAVRDACILPPRSRTEYAFFHVSEVDTTAGALPVGKLTVGGGHAHTRAGVQAALAHYDNCGAAWAYVRAGEDEFGIWVAGVVHPDATEAQIREGASSPLSGDWRKVGGNLELVAALSVNTPGFPIVRGVRDETGREVALVAAGALPVPEPETRVGELSVEQIAEQAAVTAVREYRASEQRSSTAAGLAQRLGADRASRAAALAARLTPTKE